jgi:hypothetical protein
MAKPASPTRPATLPEAQAEQLATVEDMIATLRDLRRSTGDRALLVAYRAAIDRLDALAYRLTPPSPAPAPKPPRADPAASPPQSTLPLGPVIVVARKPRRR